MTRLALLICALAAATANGSELREEISSALRASRRVAANHEICYKILDAWWDTRVELNKWTDKNSGTVAQSDELCNHFSGHGEENTDACNTRNSKERKDFRKKHGIASKIDGIDMDNIPCIMTGTNVSPKDGRRCVSNYCNQLNDGTCDLDKSGGQCTWWTANDIKTINKHTGGSLAGMGHGCYRNPCNMPGYGKADEECPSRGNGIFKCTWCYGAHNGVKDSKLFGQVNGKASQRAQCGSASRLCAYNIANAGAASSISIASDGQYVCPNGGDSPTVQNGIVICQGTS